MIENPSTFQRLVNNDEIETMIADLQDLEGNVPDNADPEDVDYYEVALGFTPEDVPMMLEELEELRDDTTGDD